MIPHNEDAWPHLEDQLQYIVRDAAAMLMDWRGLLPQMEARYREGEREHERDWLTRGDEWFVKESAEELCDLLVYLAMRRFLNS